MRRLLILFLLVLAVLAGCGEKKADLVALDPQQQSERQSKEEINLTPVIGPHHPVRDPFATGNVVTVNEGKPALALPTTQRPERDPFREKSLDAKIPVKGREVLVAEMPTAEQPGKKEQGTEGGQATENLVLELVTLERCWFDVFVDRKRVLRTNVPAKESLKWQGSLVELAQVGRAWAVLVTVNGQELGLLEELAAQLENGSVTVAGVKVTLARKYPGGVLLGLRFSAVE